LQYYVSLVLLQTLCGMCPDLASFIQ